MITWNIESDAGILLSKEFTYVTTIDFARSPSGFEQTESQETDFEFEIGEFKHELDGS